MPSISVTSLSQYIRLENCDRFLHFRLNPQEERRLLKRWNLTIQPLTPLLQDSGAEFERDVDKHIAGSGEKVIDLDGKDIAATVQTLRDVRSPVIMLQAELLAHLGDFELHGRADAVRLERDRKGALRILVADVKASRNERTEHRVQVAVYARMIQQLAQAESVAISEMKGAVLHIQENGAFPSLRPDTATFDLETYFVIINRLLTDPDSTVHRIASQPFEDAFYHLGFKCDGCLYNAICMYDSAERMDLSLTPGISSVEKRVLLESGFKTVGQVAGLMDLPTPGSGKSELTVAKNQQANVDKLSNRWPVGPNLPMIVQRAKRALHRFGEPVRSTSFLYGSDFGSMPSEEAYPDIVKVFFDAQHDYIEDRIYMLAGIVVGPKGEKVVLKTLNEPPTDASEATLLANWVQALVRAARAVANADAAPIHLYCYNRYDQKVLLEALKRHFERLSAFPAFFDLMTSSAAVSQPIISFLADELRERMNLGIVCMPLHDAARSLGFDWDTEQYHFFSLFRARLFDNRRSVTRATDGSLVAMKRG